MSVLGPKSTNEISRHKRSNGIQSALLILTMISLLAIMGFVLYGWLGLAVAVAIAIFGVIFGRMASPAMVLRMYNAQPLNREQAPQLVDLFHELCRRGGLEVVPKLYYVPTRMPNAFAVGHEETSAVALTDGLMRMMNPRELAGIMAHEISHLRHWDTKTLGTADAISRMVTVFSRIGLITMLFSISSIAFGGTPWKLLITGLILFFAPTISILLQLALSRSREFSADLGAVELTGDPYGLSSALEKLQRLEPQGFLKRILRPGQKRNQPAMLRTHPPTKERIERLLGLVKRNQVASVPVRNAVIPDEIIFLPPRVKRKPRYHIMSGVWK